MQILFVDDNPLMQQVINHFLISQGYQVTIAETGEEALTAVRVAPCQLCVLDMRLPDTDGPALLHALRQEQGMAQCPAIAVSGLGEADRERTVAAGFEYFLSKPLDLDQLLELVAAHTRGG